MPNVIIDIIPEPSIIGSGASTKLVITYEAITAGPLELRTSAPFTISRSSIPLAPDPNGHVQESVAIKRTTPNAGPARCDVLATFFTSSLHFFVEVT